MSIKHKRGLLDRAGPAGDRAKEILKSLSEAKSLRAISMSHSFDSGRMEGEPGAKDMRSLMLSSISDAGSFPAVLFAVSDGTAEWEVSVSGKKEAVRVDAGSWGSNVFEAAEAAEFRQWSRLAVKTLIGSGRDPERLKIPGMLSVSMTGKVVFGWEEDPSHPDAMLLQVGEVMDC